MKTSFAIYFEVRNRSVRSLFKGAVASFCDVISVKISLLYTKKKINQICRFCSFFLNNQYNGRKERRNFLGHFI